MDTARTERRKKMRLQAPNPVVSLETLTEPRMLDDAELNWGLLQLQALYPSIDGLESTLNSHHTRDVGGFSQVENRGARGIQIFHSPAHWTWCCWESGEIYFGDSLFSKEPPREVQECLIVMFPPPKGTKLSLFILKVSQQKDHFSCGLFTLASCFLLASRMLNPDQMSGVVFDETSLWDWFRLCVSEEFMSPPPFSFKASLMQRPERFQSFITQRTHRTRVFQGCATVD
jgi:hypothetical protein